MENNNSSNVFGVALEILNQLGKNVSHMKLQKLVYYCQVWSLVWNDKPLFPEPIQAWINGPVAPCLYQALKGKFLVTKEDLGQNPCIELDEQGKQTIAKVLDFYGEKSPQWLSDLTHMEDPWIKARKNLLPNERGEEEISLSSMAEYYGSL